MSDRLDFNSSKPEDVAEVCAERTGVMSLVL